MSTPFPSQPQLRQTPPNGGPIEVRVVAGGAGAAWWGDGWRTFTSNVWTWIGIVLAYGVISLLLERVPYIGELAHWLLTPVFIGGIMVGCYEIDRHEPLRFVYLFDGFKGPHFIPLLTVGVINIGLVLVAVCVGLLVLVGTVGMSGVMSFGNLTGDPWQVARGMGFATFLIVVVALVLVTVIIMANWFAPALIVLREVRPVDAMLTSFRSSMRNWVPFLVYGAIGVCILLAVFAVFAVLVGIVGIGAVMAMFQGHGGGWGSLIFAALLFFVVYAVVLLIISPVVFGSTYASYRDTLAPEAKIDNPAYR
jgi:hypothetical protein